MEVATNDVGPRLAISRYQCWEAGSARTPAAKKVIMMRRDRHDTRQAHDAVQRRERAVTWGELSRAIEQRRIPFTRKGDEYVMRASDVRALARQRDSLRDALPDLLRGRDTLEMGRPA